MSLIDSKLLLLRLYPFINIHYYFQRCSNLENLNFDWILLGSATGKSPIALPEKFEQLLVKIEYGNSVFCLYALKDWLTETSKAFRAGYGMSENTYNIYTGVNITITTVMLEAWRQGSVDNSASTAVTVYYR